MVYLVTDIEKCLFKDYLEVLRMDEKQFKDFKRRVPMCTKSRKWLPDNAAERRLWTKMRKENKNEN